ncbi:MAG: radical SAM protein, partial [Polyangiaceae bacterium]|nr:radical SAM protein [Polyangiaceae bacterium]
MRRLPIVESRSAILESLPDTPSTFGEAGVLPLLTDAQGRAYDYLRLSVTDRCDLACLYCMPPSGEEDHAVRAELLSFEEASRLVGVLAAMGIRRVRFTGGEPLVRKDVVRLVEKVRATTAVERLVMTTNATRLADLAKPLRDAGLDGVNVSIDSLDEERFRRITRGGELSRVLAGIHAAVDAGLALKINVVALGGENDDEVARLVDFAWSLGATPRFIELMPLGEGAKLPTTMRMSAADVISLLGSRIGDEEGVRSEGEGPARYRMAKDGSGRRVGFITPLSDEF